MSFARLSIQEIEILQSKKCSGLEWSIYAIISSHIHSVKKNTAYPSLKRIQSLLGVQPPTIQSIVRAISKMVKKGILEKGKIRTQSRFTLIHRPIITISKKMANQARKFVSRYTPHSLSNLITNKKTNRFKDTNPNGLHKRDTLKGNFNSLSKRMDDLWSQICPVGFDDKIRTENISEDKKIIFLEWVRTSGAGKANWIYETYTEQIENISRGL
jgi:hypothetical protein